MAYLSHFPVPRVSLFQFIEGIDGDDWEDETAMKRILLTSIIITIMLLASRYLVSHGLPQAEPVVSASVNAPSLSVCHEFKTHGSLTAAEFTRRLFDHYSKQYFHFRKEQFLFEAKRFALDPDDQSNRRRFTQIYFIHDMIKGNGTSNGSHSGFLKIPYFWHWVPVNPRLEIMRRPGGHELKDLPPPSGWGPYKNWATVDRFPRIFFTDLFTESPGYSTEETGDFHSFGWCSEREPAYLVWLSAFDITGKVIGKGGHVASVVYLPVNSRKSSTTNPEMISSTDSKTRYLSIYVDNTYDMVQGIEILDLSNQTVQKMIDSADQTGSKYQKRYNREAHSPENIMFFNNLELSVEVQKRIINRVHITLTKAFEYDQTSGDLTPRACLEKALGRDG